MPKCRIKNVRITGIVTGVPKGEKCIDDELDLFQNNKKRLDRIKQTIGLNKRRVVDSSTTAADLCELAGVELLEKASIPPSGVDAVICVTQMPDYPQPCNAAVLHGRMGFSKDCAAFDVNLGCSGYVYGLWLAHTMIAGGGCEQVLLLAGDTTSQLVHERDRSVAPIFGDGGSATLLERCNDERVAHFNLYTDGSGYDNLIVPAGGARCPRNAQTAEPIEDEMGNVRSAENLFMDGSKVFNFAISEEPGSVRDLLEYAEADLNQVDYFVFHQANRYILINIAKRLNLDPAKVPMQTLEDYGNQSSASIPSVICGELASVVMKSEASTVFLSGFGVGLSWANALVSMSNLSVCKCVELA